MLPTIQLASTIGGCMTLMLIAAAVWIIGAIVSGPPPRKEGGPGGGPTPEDDDDHAHGHAHDHA